MLGVRADGRHRGERHRDVRQGRLLPRVPPGAWRPASAVSVSPSLLVACRLPRASHRRQRLTSSLCRVRRRKYSTTSVSPALFVACRPTSAAPPSASHDFSLSRVSAEEQRDTCLDCSLPVARRLASVPRISQEIGLTPDRLVATEMRRCRPRFPTHANPTPPPSPPAALRRCLFFSTGV